MRILVHPEAVHVNWQNVRSLAPKFWDPASKESFGRRIDLAVHIGMASSRPQYSLEYRAHRDGYKLKDVDGEVLGDEERRALEGEKWVWAGCPEELFTDVDVEDVLGRWKTYTAVSPPPPGPLLSFLPHLVLRVLIISFFFCLTL